MINSGSEWMEEDKYSVVKSRMMELRLCETRHTFLRPDQPYVFTVDTNCPECVRLAVAAKGGV